MAEEVEWKKAEANQSVPPPALPYSAAGDNAGGPGSEISVPPIGPDKLPPPYTPTPQGGRQMTRCRKCWAMIDMEEKQDLHVCHKATGDMEVGTPTTQSCPPGNITAPAVSNETSAGKLDDGLDGDEYSHMEASGPTQVDQAGTPPTQSNPMKNISLRSSAFKPILGRIDYQDQTLNTSSCSSIPKQETDPNNAASFISVNASPTVEKSPSPMSLEENLSPMSLEENLSPMSLEENLSPMSLEENLSPMSLEENLSPMSLEEIPSPMSWTENPSPMSGAENPSPMSGAENPSLMSGAENPSPMSEEECPSPGFVE